MTMDAVHAALSRQRAATEAAALTSAVRSLSRAPRVAEAPKVPVVLATEPEASRRRAEPWPIPKTGEPRPVRGRMWKALYGTRHNSDGTCAVSLQGYASTRVTLHASDHKRAMDAGLTGSRWMLIDGEVRAYKRGPKRTIDMSHTYSVAALILGAQDGDVIHMEDCLDLRPERMRLERRGGH